MNKIVVELHPEDRARLDAVIAGLQALASAPAAPATPLPPAMMDAAFQRFLEKREQEEKIQAAAAEVFGKDQAPAPAPAPAAEFPVVPDQSPWDLTTPAAPAPAPAPAVKPVSLAEFQKAITLRCAESAETKAAVRGLVREYATSVSVIPEEKRSEFLAKLAAI